MAGHGEPKPMRATAGGPLRGRAEMPGDKSVSHRSLILGALAVGETRITGLLEGEDVLDTGRAMQAFGATVERVGAGRLARAGRRRRRLPGADDVIDHGNSGTGVRLVMGAMATTDDHRDLHRRRQPPRPADGADDRPAGAVRRRGARAARRPAADHADRRGQPDAGALHDAGAVGAGEVGGAARRPERARRDRGDRAGADPRPHRADAGGLRRDDPDRGRRRRPGDHAAGQPELQAQTIAVPRDPSSAAFPVVAALLVAGLRDRPAGGRSQPDPRRTLRDAASRWAPTSRFADRREEGGEPVADLSCASRRSGASRCRRSARRR